MHLLLLLMTQVVFSNPSLLDAGKQKLAEKFPEAAIPLFRECIASADENEATESRWELGWASDGAIVSGLVLPTVQLGKGEPVKDLAGKAIPTWYMGALSGKGVKSSQGFFRWNRCGR